ncbi:MAG: type III-A CRISPR-associated protein Csm2 [Candidatus Heimdallarchaeota archaeon]
MIKISRGNYPKQRREPRAGVAQEILKNIDLILNCSNHKKFVSFAEQFGREMKNKNVKTSQIRKIYTEVQKIRTFTDSEDQMRLHMLRPKLAYAKGRHANLSDLQKVFDKLIVNIENAEHLKNFKQFFEAVLAYHKAFGGAD